MRPRVLSGVMATLLVTGLVGCSSATQADRPRTTGLQGTGAGVRSAASAPAVAPSRVTEHDYEHAVRLMGACAAKSKVELLNAGWDPVTNQRMMLGWKAPSMAADQSREVVRKCRVSHLDAVEAQYAAQHRPWMSPELMSAVRKCLTDKGISVTGRERTAQDLHTTVPHPQETKLYDCVHTVAYKVYPGLQVVRFP